MAKRDYTKATQYENSPEQVKNREARNRARALVEKKLGHKLPPNVDVDHKVPIKNGGTDTSSNLRAISEHRNTAWRKGQKGYKVKSV
jgi:5-methylcytosine-specific restriction endonuclease McrA